MEDDNSGVFSNLAAFVDWVFGYSVYDSVAIICLLLSIAAFTVSIFRIEIAKIGLNGVDEIGRRNARLVGGILFAIFLVARFAPTVASLLVEQDLEIFVGHTKLTGDHELVAINSAGEIVPGRLRIVYGQENIIKFLSKNVRQDLPRISDELQVVQGTLSIFANTEDQAIDVLSHGEDIFIYHTEFGRVLTLEVRDKADRKFSVPVKLRQAELVSLSDPNVRLYKPVIVYQDEQGNDRRHAIGDGLDFDAYDYGRFTRYLKRFEFPRSMQVNILPQQKGGMMKSGEHYDPEFPIVAAKYFPLDTTIRFQTMSGQETEAIVRDCLGEKASSDLAISPAVAESLEVPSVGQLTLRAQVTKAPYSMPVGSSRSVVATECRTPVTDQ